MIRLIKQRQIHVHCILGYIYSSGYLFPKSVVSVTGSVSAIKQLLVLLRVMICLRMWTLTVGVIFPTTKADMTAVTLVIYTTLCVVVVAYLW